MISLMRSSTFRYSISFRFCRMLHPSVFKMHMAWERWWRCKHIKIEEHSLDVNKKIYTPPWQILLSCRVQPKLNWRPSEMSLWSLYGLDRGTNTTPKGPALPALWKWGELESASCNMSINTNFIHFANIYIAMETIKVKVYLTKNSLNISRNGQV